MQSLSQKGVYVQLLGRFMSVFTFPTLFALHIGLVEHIQHTAITKEQHIIIEKEPYSTCGSLAVLYSTHRTKTVLYLGKRA